MPFEGGWFVTSSVLYPLLKKIRAEFSIEFPVMHTFKGVACTGNIIKEEDNINISKLQEYLEGWGVTVNIYDE